MVIYACLIILLEAKEFCAFAEAPAADVKSVGADDTTALSADSAAAVWGSFCIIAWVFWDEVDWHLPKKEDQPKPSLTIKSAIS